MHKRFFLPVPDMLIQLFGNLAVIHPSQGTQPTSLGKRQEIWEALLGTVGWVHQRNSVLVSIPFIKTGRADFPSGSSQGQGEVELRASEKESNFSESSLHAKCHGVHYFI